DVVVDLDRDLERVQVFVEQDGRGDLAFQARVVDGLLHGLVTGECRRGGQGHGENGGNRFHVDVHECTSWWYVVGTPVKGLLVRGCAGRDYTRGLRPKISDSTNSTRKTKNRIFAMPADAPAMPPKPRTAATRAMTRKTMA